MREEDTGGIYDFHGQIRQNWLHIRLPSALLPFLMTNYHSAPHVTHTQVRSLTNIVFQEMTSCSIHCSKLKHMIQLVAMVAENVQHGIRAVNILLKACLCMMSLLDMVQCHGSTTLYIFNTGLFIH